MLMIKITHHCGWIRRCNIRWKLAKENWSSAAGVLCSRFNESWRSSAISWMQDSSQELKYIFDRTVLSNVVALCLWTSLPWSTPILLLTMVEFWRWLCVIGPNVSVHNLRIFGVLQRLALTFCAVAVLEVVCAISADPYAVSWVHFVNG